MYQEEMEPMSETPEPAPPVEPAVFPRGFWRRVDYLLQNPERVLESIRQEMDLGRLAGLFFIISVAMAALYGAVMGATNLLQATPSFSLTERCLMILITAVKVPALFLLTLFIVLWPIYMSNAFWGARLSFIKVLVVMLASTAVMAVMLASMASVAFFFALTTASYHFIKLLHVAFFIYAGATGLGFLTRCLATISADSGRRTPSLLFVGWLILYMFVGAQMAWVLRPFVGSPGERFEVFRPRSGNFYESVGDSISKLLVGEPRDR